MSWTLLLPAGATLLALIALTTGLRRVGEETNRLRRSLRRSGAAAIAVNDLERTAVGLRTRLDHVQHRIRDRQTIAGRPRDRFDDR